MIPRTRWFALLGPALAASMAAAASAQPKGAPAGAEAGKKHPAPGMHAGPAGRPPMMGRGPKAKDKDKDKDKDSPEGQGQAKGQGAHDAGTAMRPRPPGAQNGGLRRPPDFRRRHAPAPNAELRKKWQERRADQMKRRRAALQQLRERWGEDQLSKPAVKAAIGVHAWRMARLKRIRELALQDPDGKDLVEKTDKLIEKEQERFRVQMARLKKGSDVGTVGDAGSAPPATAKAPPAPSTPEQKEGAAQAAEPAASAKEEGAQ
jgi:hypothetical protein